MTYSLFLAAIFMLLYYGYGVRVVSSAFLLVCIAISEKRICARRALLLLLYVILLTTASERVLDSTALSFGFPESEVVRITGYAVTDSTNARYSSSRLTVSLSECNTKYGAVASARGNISVTVKGGAEILAGDLVSFDGKLGKYGFSARSCFIRKRPSYNRARLMAISFLRDRIDAGDEESQLSMMLLLGITEDPESELAALARTSGTSYVLALSGMHLGLFSMFLAFFLKPLYGKRGARAISLIFLFFYVALIGPKPSLVRALLLSLMFFIFQSLSAIENLALTFLVQLVLFPSSAISLSSVFSYLSLAGILGFLPLLSASAEKIAALPRFVSPVIVSASALVYTVPFTYSVFGEYQLSSLLTSGVISVLIYIYMILSIVVLFFSKASLILRFVYTLIYKMMKAGSLIPMQQTLFPFIIFLLSILSVLLLSCILRDRRSVKRCGSLTMTVRRK